MDRRIRKSEFAMMLGVSKTKLYYMTVSGEVKQPHRASQKDVFWYESYVKEKVEEYKCDNIAHA